MVRLAHLCNLLQKGSSLIPSSSHRRILLAVDGNLTHVGLSLMVHNCKYRLLSFFFFLPRKFPQNFISKYVLNYEPRIERSFSEATVCSRIGCSESTQLRRRRGLKLPFRTGSCIISFHFSALRCRLRCMSFGDQYRAGAGRSYQGGLGGGSFGGIGGGGYGAPPPFVPAGGSEYYRLTNEVQTNIETLSRNVAALSSKVK